MFYHNFVHHFYHYSHHFHHISIPSVYNGHCCTWIHHMKFLKYILFLHRSDLHNLILRCKPNHLVYIIFYLSIATDQSHMLLVGQSKKKNNIANNSSWQKLRNFTWPEHFCSSEKSPQSSSPSQTKDLLIHRLFLQR